MIRLVVRSVTLVLLGVLSLAFSVHRSLAQGDCVPNMLLLSGQDSYVATPDANSLHLATGFTIECWARADQTTRTSGILEKSNGTFTYYGLVLDTATRVAALAHTNVNVRLLTGDSDLRAWHHYAFVFAPGDSFYFYVDGVETASQKAPATLLGSSKDSLIVGMSRLGTGFAGAIDELRIWNTPRSQGAIVATMTHPLAGTEPGLVLYYPFDDEINATRIHDFSGHANDGYLRGPNASIVASNSPILLPTRGFRLDTREKRLIIPTKRCSPYFDTVIHVRNLGTEALQLNSVGYSSGKVFSVTSNFPLSLAPDSSQYQPITIHFSPSSGGVFYDTLTLTSTDICAGVVRIGIQASYDSVGLSVSPSVVDFGTHTQCDLPQLRAVTIRNVSTTDSITVTSASLPAGVTISSPLPIRLAARESRSFTLSINAGASGFSDANLRVFLDKCSREASIEVTGTRQRAEIALPSTVTFAPRTASLVGIALDTIVLLRNTGDIAMPIRSVLSSDPHFSITTDLANQVIQPGATLQVPIHVTPDGCGYFATTIRATGYICSADTSTLVSVTIRPPKPLQAQAFDFGLVCELADSAIVIRNPNGEDVRLDTVSFSSDAVFFTPEGVFPRIVHANDTIVLPLRFAPGVSGDFKMTAFLHSSPCGLQPVAITGTKGLEVLSFDKPSVSFGRGCDTSELTTTLQLRNSSSRGIDLQSAALIGSSQLSIDPIANVRIRPGDSLAIMLHYLPKLGTKAFAQLLLTSTQGCTSMPLAVQASRETGRANWLQSEVNFDTVCPGSTLDRQVQIRNTGIDTLDLRAIASSDPAFTILGAPASIAPDSSGSITVHFAPTALTAYNADLTATLDACGTLLHLPLVGSGGPPPEILASSSVIDFGNVGVDSMKWIAIDISNPSCSPITIDTSMFGVLGAFDLDSASRASLPRSIGRGTVLHLRFTFHPIHFGSDSVRIVLRGAGATDTLLLKGTGVGPDLLVTETLLDFGYVVHGLAKSLYAHIKNIGNDTAFLTVTNSGTPDFSESAPRFVAPGDTSSILVTFQPQPSSGLLYATLFVRTGEHLDTVMLRGQGTGIGTQISALGLDFGDVHLHHDSVEIVYVTATSAFPTLNAPQIVGPSAPRFSVRPNASYTITSDKDTLRLFVRYRPEAEVRDSATLVVSDASGKTIYVPLVGEGVETHLVVNPVSIDFGPVVLGQSFPIQSVRVTDTGGYPATLTGVNVSSSFSVDFAGPVMIAPHQSIKYQVTFEPQRAKRIIDTLVFRTDSAGLSASVVLSGTGTYPAGQNPVVGYAIGSVSLNAGERTWIPVTISGLNLYHIDSDSVTLVLRYDSTMVRLLDARTPQDPQSRVRLTRLSEGSSEIAFRNIGADSGHVLDILAEALLGANPVTQIVLERADPPRAITPAADDGLFSVLDCGGQIHGVEFSGEYQLQNASPNPANDVTRVAYTLGLPGTVTLDVYNALGARVRTIVTAPQTRGGHSLALDAGSLPNGRYVYRLRSLEFTREGTLVVLH